MSGYPRDNLLRLMATEGLSVHQVAQRTGLDARTVRGILAGRKKPHSQTLHRLAEGLGVKADELFVDPTRLVYRRFDRHTNPLVDEVIENHQELFDGWTEADFDELHSRVGEGGALTSEGTLTAVQHMNHKRRMHELLDLLLESSQVNTVSAVVEALFTTTFVSE